MGPNCKTNNIVFFAGLCVARVAVPGCFESNQTNTKVVCVWCLGCGVGCVAWQAGAVGSGASNERQ